MAFINLRDLFPDEELDCIIEVPDGDATAFKAGLTKETADVYFAAQREENAYQRRVYWNKAHYSLDVGDGIESEAINETPGLFEILSDKLEKQELLDALNSLPEKQRRRICDHYFKGVSKAEIARSEGVDEKSVRQAIERGITALKNLLKNFSE